MRGKGDKGGTVIIKKEEVIAGGHHGGAWKVAYADFVTAMMAFFLLMWLLNATTEEQRKGLADYFSPTNFLSHGSSGTGQPFGGSTAFDEGSMVSDRGAVDITMGRRPDIEVQDDTEAQVITETPTNSAADSVAAHKFDHTGQTNALADQNTSADVQIDSGDNLPLTGIDKAALRQAEQAQRRLQSEARDQREKNEKAAFDKAAQEIQDAVRDDPALHDLMKQLTIDMTPEGMRIQLLDEDRLPMFTTGSAVPNDRARLLLQKITPVLMRLPEGISLSGHTDAAPFPSPGRTNWELSTERANMTRRLLLEQGLPESRIRTVTGHADRDPLLPNDPMAAANRRIAIIVLREANKPASPPKPKPPSPQPKQ